MAHAYTPGLKVTGYTVLEKVRRLPLKGEVLVQVGDEVEPSAIVARTSIPGDPETINAAHELACDPQEIPRHMLKQPGERVAAGEVIASYQAFFGLLKKRVVAPVDGTVEHVSEVTGRIILRRPPIPVEVRAYVRGRVKEVLPEEGVVIEARGAFVQGIFGVGGERQGTIRLLADSAEAVLDADAITPDCRGAVVIGGSLVTGAALRRAAEVGCAGVVAGGIIDRDLLEYLGYDIGVAITGHEDVGCTLIVTEGFGRIRMARRTFELLRALDGWEASINGATQIRAGVMRPELIVAGYRPPGITDGEVPASEGLVAGTPIRAIRDPYFGLLGEVVELPPELQPIETGARVRVLRARLEDGRTVTIPRANVEIIEG